MSQQRQEESDKRERHGREEWQRWEPSEESSQGDGNSTSSQSDVLYVQVDITTMKLMLQFVRAAENLWIKTSSKTLSQEYLLTQKGKGKYE